MYVKCDKCETYYPVSISFYHTTCSSSCPKCYPEQILTTIGINGLPN